jgi:hypothetical protein
MGGGRSSASHADIAGPVKRVTKKKPWYSASTRACPHGGCGSRGTAAMRLNGIAWQHEPAAPSYCGKTLQGITPPSRRAAQKKKLRYSGGGMLGLRWQLYSGLVGLSLLAASTEYRPPRNSSQQPVPSHSHFVPFLPACSAGCAWNAVAILASSGSRPCSASRDRRRVTFRVIPRTVRHFSRSN